MIVFNPESDQHTSCLLYGGSLKEKVIEPIFDEYCQVILFKSGHRTGQIKTHLVEKEVKIRGLLIVPKDEWKCKQAGFWKTNEQILKEISSWFRDDQEAVDTGIASKEGVDAKEIIDLILKLRGLNKELQTYYEGLKENIEEDRCVRGQYQHVKTETCRLSCSNPNLQNISGKPSKIKQIFISRFK